MGSTSDLVGVAAIGVIGYLLVKKISDIGGSVSNTATTYIEKVTEKVESLKNEIGGITEKVESLNNEMNDNPILKYIAPDIQRPSEMTETQKTALEEYKKGNVTTKTVADPNSLYSKLFGKKQVVTPNLPEKKISISSLPSIPTSAATHFEAATKIYKNPPNLPEKKISISSLPSIPTSAATHFEAATKIYKNPPNLPEKKISISSLPSIPTSAATHFEAATKIYKNPPQLPEKKISVTSLPSIPTSAAGSGKSSSSGSSKITTVKVSSGGYSVARESGTTVNQGRYAPIKVKR
jgi:hypothetical protein